MRPDKNAPVRELQEINDVMVVWELRGDFPDVPLAPGVDRDALVAGDPDPVFLTLPIGKANVKSGNGRFYDETWLAELERQTLANKPVGLMGHLDPKERGYAMPDEAVHWVGATRIGELLWGKGYIPEGPMRDRIRRYKATGAKIATSIDAFAEGIWDEALKAYRMAADTLRLNQIDIAPADRAGIPALAAVPILTTEMADEAGEDGPADDNPDSQEKTMDKLDVIREMTVEDAPLLPEPVREAILAAVPAPPEVALVAEMREALGTEDVLAALREMKAEQEQQRRAAIAGRIRELVEDEERGVKAKAMRPFITELVEAQKPQTVEEAEAAYTRIVERESVREMLAAHVAETMGPAQRSGLQSQNGAARYFDIPKEND